MDGNGMISSDDERKPWLTALETRVAQVEPNLSANRQALIREILDHADETYFLSSRALAKKYDLDPTTIVRTVQALGYKRYGEFAAELRSHFVARITPYALMKSAVRDKRSVVHHIEHTVEMDSEKSPIARFSDTFWLTSIASTSFHGSYVAVVSAINALLVACSQLHPQRSLKVLRRKEQEFRSRWYTPLSGKSGKRNSDRYE